MQEYLPQTAKGHEQPFAVQFSIFLSNRVGQLKELLSLLIARNLKLLGLSIVDSTDWAVIRMVLSDPLKAVEVFKLAAVQYVESNVLMVELPSDKSLVEICSHLIGAEINVHFAYPLTYRRNSLPVMVFHVDDTVLATQLLLRHGFILIGHEDFSDND